jgi:mono/diheme cytochrome c family protein
MEWFYQLLAVLGYQHPLHPPLVHLPIGMVMGAFIFHLVATLRKSSQLETTARHCGTLALCALLPVSVVGYLDWQHRYAGAWLLPIKMKLLLAGILLMVLGVCFARRHHRIPGLRFSMACYALPLLLVAALGYFGGELVYGTLPKATKAEVVSASAGEPLFQRNCAGCHPNGENPLKPALAPRNAPQLADEKAFLEFLRHPKARDGSDSRMPAFPEDKLTDGEARQIRRYVLEVLRRS